MAMRNRGRPRMAASCVNELSSLILCKDPPDEP